MSSSAVIGPLTEYLHNPGAILYRQYHVRNVAGSTNLTITKLAFGGYTHNCMYGGIYIRRELTYVDHDLTRWMPWEHFKSQNYPQAAQKQRITTKIGEFCGQFSEIFTSATTTNLFLGVGDHYVTVYSDPKYFLVDVNITFALFSCIALSNDLGEYCGHNMKRTVIPYVDIYCDPIQIYTQKGSCVLYQMHEAKRDVFVPIYFRAKSTLYLHHQEYNVYVYDVPDAIDGRYNKNYVTLSKCAGLFKLTLLRFTTNIQDVYRSEFHKRTNSTEWLVQKVLHDLSAITFEVYALNPNNPCRMLWPAFTYLIISTDKEHEFRTSTYDVIPTRGSDPLLSIILRYGVIRFLSSRQSELYIIDFTVSLLDRTFDILYVHVNHLRHSSRSTRSPIVYLKRVAGKSGTAYNLIADREAVFCALYSFNSIYIDAPTFRLDNLYNVSYTIKPMPLSEKITYTSGIARIFQVCEYITI